MKNILICVVILLSGCATMEGVNATKDERRACALHGCTVWTERELIELVRRASRYCLVAPKHIFNPN